MSIESILKTRMEKAEQCLTPASRRIASYLQENYSEVAAMTAMALAAKTQTSPATVVRFCYSLGFDGFSDLKSFLDKNTREPCAGLYDLLDTDPARLIRQKVCDLHQNVIGAADRVNDDELYETVANVLLHAPHILIFGNGGSGCIARCAYDLFLQVGIHCNFVADPVFELLEIKSLQPGDVIFMISHGGQLSNIYENLRCAKNAGITTIGITGRENNPLSAYLDYRIKVGDTKQDYFSSILTARIGELYAVSMLFSIITLRGRHMNRTHATYLSNFCAPKCVLPRNSRKTSDHQV